MIYGASILEIDEGVGRLGPTGLLGKVVMKP